MMASMSRRLRAPALKGLEEPISLRAGINRRNPNRFWPRRFGFFELFLGSSRIPSVSRGVGATKTNSHSVLDP